jgi:signal transduction histidine kinase
MAVSGDEREAPATAQLALYRIVQESLTNILKHGRNVRHVTVDITYQAHDVTVDVVNDGDSVSAVDSADRGGHGLHGMRERAALYGGDVRAAPRPGGGWAVTAELHLTDQNPAHPRPANPNRAKPNVGTPNLANPAPTP